MCLTLCDSMAYTVHGILQATILEWVAYPLSRGSFQTRNQTTVFCIAGKFLAHAGDPGLIPRSGRSSGEGIGYPFQCSWTSLVAQLVKNLTVMWEAWVGKIPGEGKGYPLQYSGLENSMDCIVHEVAKSQTQLSDFHSHTLILKMFTAKGKI